MIRRLLIISALFAAIYGQAMTVGRMTCELSQSPLAVETAAPRFGWQLAGADGDMQTAYQLEVAQRSGDAAVWISGRVESDRSQLVRYAGSPLAPATRYKWRVKVWDGDGKPSRWSRWEEFATAPDSLFLTRSQWVGAVTYDEANFPQGRNFTADKWKKPDIKKAWEAVDTLASRNILLRKDFSVKGRIAEATAYVCGLGHYELHLNGKKLGDSEFAPLWSDYEKTVYYNAFDVTDQLRRGVNAFGVMLGNGFYNVVRGSRYSKLQIGFGPETLWLKLLVRYTDGTVDTIQTDGSWRYLPGPITFHSMYGGEDYDARLLPDGWDRPGFDASAWRPVKVQRAPIGKLSAQAAPPVKIMKRYPVVSAHKLTKDEVEKSAKSTKRTLHPSAITFDMGQNLSGFPEITLRGKRGQTVMLICGESLTPEGAANQSQTGRQHYFTYTLGSDGTETWHPRFSYYGFRYIQVEGAVVKGASNPDGLPVIEDLNSCFVHNSAQEVGTFECSNPILTSAHHLIRNAVCSNMQAVFTDCPHREKLGWLEEVHLNGIGLLSLFDLSSMLPKVIRDIADSQREDGMVPTTAPLYAQFEGKGGEPFANSPEWAATLLVTPWQYFETYGDDSLIREYYPRMRAHVDYLGSRAEGNLIDFGLGDWYDYGDFRAGFSRNTPVGHVASAHYYLDLLYLIKSARLLGKAADAERYSAIAADVRKAFNDKYFDPKTGQYGTGSQTSLSLPLYLGLVPDGERNRVIANLVADIRKHGTRLTTGDVGNRYLFRTLADCGLDSLMYEMHNHEEAPGYGYQLKFGATTLTEQWDPRHGSSWNHFMMGQIEEWLFRSILGIRIATDDILAPTTDPSRCGRHFEIAPSPVGDLTHASGTVPTLYGPVSVSWSRPTESEFVIEVTLPVNTSATLRLPGQAPREITSGKTKVRSVL